MHSRRIASPMPTPARGRTQCHHAASSCRAFPRWSCVVLLLGMALLMAAAPQGPPPSWWQRTDPGPGRSLPTSRHYTIRSDLAFAETKAYADLLDTMYREYTRLMQGLRRRGQEHLTVYMFASPQDYRDTLRTRFGVNAAGSGGMFFVGPRGSGLAFFTGDLPRTRIEHVIRHEGFHQVAHSYFEGNLPPWANEGLAEYFGEAVVVDGTVIEGQVTPRTVSRVKALIDNEQVIPFAQLLARDSRTWNSAVTTGGASNQYLQAASMVQFLLWGEGGRLSSNFSAYLRHLNDGRDSVSAFRMAFGGTDDRVLAEFEQRWRSFAGSQRPGSFRAAAQRLEFMAEGVLALREKGVYPQDLESLRAALLEARFEQRLEGVHGGDTILRADDEGAFEVPVDQLQDARRAPLFLVNPAPANPRSGQRPPPRNRPNERGGAPGAGGEERGSSSSAGDSSKPPPPPELSTRNLRPRDLRMSWTEGADGRWSAQLRLK
ncbi:MAG: DUF1570 domain-containing protein [Phycisphaeraceae bacterium]|nr:DUF1570 domain-containing protein [Phycisphaeraceae bacterium]